jgi:hypothetical protein
LMTGGGRAQLACDGVAEGPRVRRVVHPFAEEGVGKGPATVSRDEFLRALSGEQGRRAKEPAHGFAPRNPAGKEGDFW